MQFAWRAGEAPLVLCPRAGSQALCGCIVEQSHRRRIPCTTAVKSRPRCVNQSLRNQNRSGLCMAHIYNPYTHPCDPSPFALVAAMAPHATVLATGSYYIRTNHTTPCSTGASRAGGPGLDPDGNHGLAS